MRLSRRPSPRWSARRPRRSADRLRPGRCNRSRPMRSVVPTSSSGVDDDARDDPCHRAGDEIVWEHRTTCWALACGRKAFVDPARLHPGREESAVSNNLAKRSGWIAFAGVAALIAGGYNTLSGIAALTDDDTHHGRAHRWALPTSASADGPMLLTPANRRREQMNSLGRRVRAGGAGERRGRAWSSCSLLGSRTATGAADGCGVWELPVAVGELGAVRNEKAAAQAANSRSCATAFTSGDGGN